MEYAQLLLTQATLLSAFIFFWNQAKIGRDELKRELNTDITEMHDMNGRLGRVEGLLRTPDAC